eukprot:1159232-Pelagomonas_calceolata.AAC.14
MEVRLQGGAICQPAMGGRKAVPVLRLTPPGIDLGWRCATTAHGRHSTTQMHKNAGHCWLRQPAAIVGWYHIPGCSPKGGVGMQQQCLGSPPSINARTVLKSFTEASKRQTSHHPGVPGVIV